MRHIETLLRMEMAMEEEARMLRRFAASIIALFQLFTPPRHSMLLFSPACRYACYVTYYRLCPPVTMTPLLLIRHDTLPERALLLRYIQARRAAQRAGKARRLIVFSFSFSRRRHTDLPPFAAYYHPPIFPYTPHTCHYDTLCRLPMRHILFSLLMSAASYAI